MCSTKMVAIYWVGNLSLEMLQKECNPVVFVHQLMEVPLQAVDGLTLS